jgi:hypothetical protein
MSGVSERDRRWYVRCNPAHRRASTPHRARFEEAVMNAMQTEPMNLRRWTRFLMSSSSKTRLDLARVEIVGLFAAVAAIALYLVVGR